MVRKLRCPTDAWRILKSTLQVLSKPAIDEKMSSLRTVELKQCKGIVAYPSRIVELVSEPERALNKISLVEMKSTFLWGLTKDSNITV